jgi:hypothetical protein
VESEGHGEGVKSKNESVAEDEGEEGVWSELGGIVVRGVEELVDDEEEDDLEEIEGVEIGWL